jgi:hypothetical protein
VGFELSATNMKKTIDQVSPGETVMIGSGRNGRLLKVAKVTATQIVLDSGSRFNRKTGRRCGDHSSWMDNYLHIPSDKQLAEVERANLVNRLMALSEQHLHTLPTHVLHDAVESLTKKQSAAHGA